MSAGPMVEVRGVMRHYGAVHAVDGVDLSIDRGVMEHAAASSEFAVCMVALDVQWLDVGSWPSYAETIEADAAESDVPATTGP